MIDVNKLYDFSLEYRKSCILRLPKDFFDNHPDTDWKEIKEYRSRYLLQFLMDYNDENWQYWWATRLFIPEKDSESLEFVYEFLLEDGNRELDFFEDPAYALAHRIMFSDRDKFCF